MGIGRARTASRSFGLAAIAMIAIASCARVPYFPRTDEGRAPAPNELVVAGRVAFDPPIDPESRRTNVRDPSGRYLKARLAFTRDLRPLEDWRYADGFAAVDPEQPFAIVVPRDQRFFRSVSYHLGTRAVTYQTTAIVDMVCDRAFALALEPDDQVAYVGTITCRHQDGTPREVRVDDELERDRAAIEASFPGLRIARRLLTAIEP